MIFLFGEFTRTENAKNSDKAGWGLGLPLVKGLVEAHNGLINVSSDAESGTSFIIQMPMTLLCHNEYNDNSKYNP